MLLKTRACKFLGDVSYSLYLTHTVLLIILLNLVTSFMGHSGLAALVFCISSILFSFAVALLSYRTIELGGIRLGEYLRKQDKPELKTCNTSH